jgi:hypothetical protein
MGTHTRNRVTNALQSYLRQRGRPSSRNSIPLVLHNDNEDILRKMSTVQVLVRSGGVNHLLKAPFWGHGQPLIWHYQERYLQSHRFHCISPILCLLRPIDINGITYWNDG